eukprot:5568734-Prorocentrum_lima.AAC.1
MIESWRPEHSLDIAQTSMEGEGRIPVIGNRAEGYALGVNWTVGGKNGRSSVKRRRNKTQTIACLN